MEASSFLHRCTMCGHIIDLGQPLPAEYAQLSLTGPFRNRLSWDVYVKSGICQDCQDLKYGKAD